MVKYTQHFERGEMQFIAKVNGEKVATIYEHPGFAGGWVVVWVGKEKGIHFSTIDASKNYIETFASRWSA